MNEVRDICERMLATPPPPLRDSGDALATARRSVARRRAGVATTSGLAVAATAAVLTVQLTAAGGSARPAPPVAAPAATTASPPAAVVAPTATPPARAAATHAMRMRQLLLPMAPRAYAVKDFPVDYDEGFDRTAVLPNRNIPAPKDGLMSVAFAGLLLSDARGEGLLSANIWATSNPGMLGGNCAGAAGPPSTKCDIVTVDGVRIEVTTWQDETGRHINASRPLDGGFLSVSAAQGLNSGESQAPLDGARKRSGTKPPLANLPFTTRQLAALAANPAMLQFP